MSCQHENMNASVQVTWSEDRPGSGWADVTIVCGDCDEPIHFKGLPRGLNIEGAARSVDGTEARLAIGIGADWPRVSNENN